MSQRNRRPGRVPHVVVVDPRFEAYADLATAARDGRIDLHLRSHGGEALRLAGRLPVDAWLVAAELDDMSGKDFILLLHDRDLDESGNRGRVAAVGSAGRSEPAATVADAFLERPLALADLEALLTLTAKDRAAAMPLPAARGGLVAVPVGIGAAMVAMAVLMMG